MNWNCIPDLNQEEIKTLLHFIISVKKQVEVTLIFSLINYLTLLALFFFWMVNCLHEFFFEKFPCRNFFGGNFNPRLPISNGPPLSISHAGISGHCWLLSIGSTAVHSCQNRHALMSRNLIAILSDNNSAITNGVAVIVFELCAL